MTDSFVAKVKSGQDQEWIVTPQIINHDGKQHADITVGTRDGIKPTVNDLVMVNLLKNNLDFSNVNEFYQASRTNGVIIGILMTSGSNYYLIGNYNFKGDFKNEGKMNNTGKVTFDDTLEVKGNTRSLVTHSELNTALQTMLTSLNTHTHVVTTAPGTTATPLPPATLDITSAKTDNIKTGAG